MRNEHECYCCGVTFVGHQGQQYCHECRYMTIAQRKKAFPDYEPRRAKHYSNEFIERVLKFATDEQIIVEIDRRNNESLKERLTK